MPGSKKDKVKATKNLAHTNKAKRNEELLDVNGLLKQLAEKEAKLMMQAGQIEILQAKLQVMREVTRVTSGNFSIEEILELFMDVVLHTTRTDAGSILMLDPQSQELIFKVTRGPKAQQVKDFKVKLGEGIAGWVAKTGESVLTEAAASDHRFSERISKAVNYNPKNLICVPLKGKSGILGVLELINRKDHRPFNHDDLGVLESLASQIAIVIENAQLFRVNQKEIYQLSALIEASQVVNSTLDLKRLLKLVMELAAKTLQAEASSILLIDFKTGDLCFEVAVGEKQDEVKEIRVPVGQGIAGWVAKEGKSLLVPDTSKDPRFFKQADEKTKFVTKSIVAVPLKAREKTIGVVEVLNKIGAEQFNEEDVRVLESLAHQSAIAIENAKLYRDLQDSFLATVRSLAAAIDAKDSYTAGHANRVTEYSVFIAQELGLGFEEVNTVRLAALMHDVGKIGIKESILSKPGKLTDEEFAEMKRHPELGAAILSPIEQLAGVIPGVRMHHERFDGRGYPDALKGNDIPLYGRIIGVADSFDAMTSDRVYRKRLSDEEALDELKKGSGTQFDGRVVEAFFRAYQKGKIKTIPSTHP